MAETRLKLDAQKQRRILTTLSKTIKKLKLLKSLRERFEKKVVKKRLTKEMFAGWKEAI